jgi:hypothetical protein
LPKLKWLLADLADIVADTINEMPAFYEEAVAGGAGGIGDKRFL